jgi:hypothetical protein
MLLKQTLIGMGLLALVMGVCACGGSAKGDGTHVLSSKEAKILLLKLPYRYRFREVAIPEGASGALAGKATMAHGTFLNFGVALGRDPGLVPVPDAGTNSAYGYPRGGFVFTDDLQVAGKNHTWHRPARFHTERQWNEAISIAVEMQKKLCKAATGEPCPP